MDGCVLMYEIWWIFSSLMKDKQEKICQMNCHCTVYTGTTWNDFAESHQLRTMNARGHINSVLWMTAVTLHCKKKVSHFPVPSRDVTDQTLPGQEKLNYSRPGRVWLVTSRLGKGKRLTLFYSVTQYNECTQFVDSVKPLLFRPIAYIHGTELVCQRSFMVRNWCDLVKWPCGVQKSA